MSPKTGVGVRVLQHFAKGNQFECFLGNPPDPSLRAMRCGWVNRPRTWQAEQGSSSSTRPPRWSGQIAVLSRLLNYHGVGTRRNCLR